MISIQDFISESALLYLITGFASIAIPVGVKIGLQSYHRRRRREELENDIRSNPSLADEIGDIDSHLDNDINYRIPNFLKELTIYSMLPLAIITAALKIEVSSQSFPYLSRSTTWFMLVIGCWYFLHEISWGIDKSNKLWYRAIIIAGWLCFYLLAAAYDKTFIPAIPTSL